MDNITKVNVNGVTYSVGQDISGKANSEDVYTKSQVDSLLDDINTSLNAKIYVPTLDEDPSSSTLTYLKDGETYNFDIGDFARVQDETKNTGYRFYQLFDIINGSAVWGEYSEKLPPTYVAPTANTLTYDTTAQILLTVGSTNDGVIEYSLDRENWDVQVPTATNAGTYVVYWKLIGDTSHNSVLPTPINVTIAKVDPTYTHPTPNVLTYNGESQNLLSAGSTDYGTFQYSENSTEWSNDVPAKTNAGSYTIYYKVTGDSNINDSTVSNIIVTIAKVTPTVTAATVNTGLVYNAQPQDLVTAGSTDWGTFQYSNAENGIYTTDVPAETNAGTYSVWYRVLGDSNINDVAATNLSITIDKAVAAYTAPTAKANLVYTGSALDLVNAGSTEDGTLQYSFDESTWTTTVPTGTNADTYTVYWRIVGDSNHYDKSSVSINNTIDKAAGEVTTAPAAKTLVYDNTIKELVDAGVGTGTMYYKLDDDEWSTAIPTATEAGTYVISYKAAESANYYESSVDTVSVIIAKVTPTVVGPTANTITYDSTAQALVSAGSTDWGTMKYSLDGENYSTSIPTATNADTYTVYYIVEGDENINDVAADTVEVTIDKVTPTVTAPTAKILTYNTAAQVLANDGSTNWGTMQYSLSENSGFSTTMPSATNVDTYTVYYKVVGDSNINDVAVSSIECEISTKVVSSPTITLEEYTYTYDTTEKEPAVLSVNDDEDTIPSSEYTVSYSNNVNAGTATVTITDNAGGNYNVSGSTTFTINRATAAYTAPTATAPTYDSLAHDLIVAGSTPDGVMQYSLDAETWSTTIPQGTNAGSYTTYWRIIGDSNHNDKAATTISTTIAKVTPTVTAPTARVLTYNTSAQNLVNAGSTNWGTLQYSLNNSTWSTSIPSATNFGSYTVYYRVVGDSNINDVASNSVACSIAEKRVSTPTITLSQSSYTYSGSACTPTVTVKDGENTIPSSEYTVTYSNNVGAGTATVTISDNVDGNYNITGSTTFTITKATPSYTAPTARTGLIYNGGAQSLLNAGSTSHGTIQYSGDGSTWSTSIPSGTNATSYAVYWRLVGDSNHTNVSSTLISVSISKVTPSVTAPTAKSLTYNGSAQTLANAGSTNWGTLQYSLDNSTYSTSVPSGTGAGGYTVYYRVVGNSNINDVAASSIACSIAKAAPSYTAPTATGPTYNGNAQNLLNAGSTSHGTIQYSSNNSSWSTSIPTGTNAGGYTSYWRLIGDANHTNVGSTSIGTTIAKAGGYVSSAPSNRGVTYNGSNQNLINAGSGTGTMYYALAGGSYSTSIPVAVTAGSYTVYYYAAESSNYTQSSVSSLTATISKASGSVSISGISSSYNGSWQSLASVSGATGTMHYSTDYSNWSTSIPSSLNAGSWTIYWYMDESTNYTGIGASTSRYVSSSIARIAPTITATPTNANRTYNGSAQYLLTGGTANVAGSFSYSTGTNAGSYNGYWIFYPSDSTNYYAVDGYVSASIAKANCSYSAPTAIKNMVYNGSARALMSAGNTSCGTIQYSSNNSSWSTTIPTGTNAGTYTSYWRIVADSNHNDLGSQSVSTTIAQASGSVSISGRSLTYNGEWQSLASVSGLTGTMHYSLDYSSWSTSIPSGLNAGTYYVYWYMDASTNYTGIGASTGRYVTTTINKRAGYAYAPADRGVTYNGSAQNLVTSGIGSGTIYYSLDNANWSTSIPSATNAGSYTVYYYAAESTNYTQSSTGSMTATILQAAGYVSGFSGGRVTYNGSYQYACTAASGTGTVYYKLGDGSWSTSRPSVLNAGSYTVYAYAAASTNYIASGTYTANFFVDKASRSVSFTSTPNNMVAGSTATVSASRTGDGNISYSSSNTAVATISGTTITAVGPGTTTITASVPATTNYNAGSASYTLTVIKTEVNLGLSSGNIWCAYNVGAPNQLETEYGLYAQWGANPNMNTAEINNYGNGIIYPNGSGRLVGNGRGDEEYHPHLSEWGSQSMWNILPDGGYDIAREIMGGSWLMPMREDIEELISQTDKELATINGVPGIKFMKKSDHSVYLFFPAYASFKAQTYTGDTDYTIGKIKENSDDCFYWTSTNYNETGATELLIYKYDNSWSVNVHQYSKYVACQIKAVRYV